MEIAEEFVRNWTSEEFAEGLKTQFAVIRALEIRALEVIVKWQRTSLMKHEKIPLNSLERFSTNTGQIDPY